MATIFKQSNYQSCFKLMIMTMGSFISINFIETGLEPRTTYSINKHSTIWPNGWVFIYKLSGSGLKSSCSHLNFRFRAWFKQGVPWHSGNYRVWIHSEMHMWHDKKIVTQKHCFKTIYSLVCSNEGRKELWIGHLRRLLIRKPWTVKLKKIMKLLQVLATL